MLAACRPEATPSPPASKPYSNTSASGTKAWKMPIALGAATDAGAHRVREPAGVCQRLCPGLDSDARCEVPDHHRERMRAGDRTQQVVRRLDVRDPVAERLVDGVLRGYTGAGGHRDHRGAEQLHPGDVEGLPADVLLAHVDEALPARTAAAAVALATPC